ncbi:MAG: gluconokinase [Planctomycetota bacterium]
MAEDPTDNAAGAVARPWVVMGVSGCGKTTVGRALATQLEMAFFDADDFHPPANVAKMRSGVPLSDADRGPWLDVLNGLLRDRPGVVLACSALRRVYRARLAAGLEPGPRFVFLEVDRATVARRMRGRDHFMPAALMASQFETLEPPTADEALVLDAGRPVDQLVAAVVVDARR